MRGTLITLVASILVFILIGVLKSGKSIFD